jgi:hypothetical protein
MLFLCSTVDFQLRQPCPLQIGIYHVKRVYHDNFYVKLTLILFDNDNQKYHQIVNFTVNHLDFFNANHP